MKRFLAPILLMVFLFPSLALGQEVTMDDLVITNGLYYKKFTNVPFTGEVTGQHQGRLKDGVKDGPWVSYHDNGQFKSEATYKDGVMDGPWVEYWDNGQLLGEVIYKDGWHEGPYLTYHENGQLWRKGTYKDGKKEGLWVWYFDNGQLGSKGTFKDGYRDGLWVGFNEDGTVDAYLTGTYKDGVKVGRASSSSSTAERAVSTSMSLVSMSNRFGIGCSL
jgi:antitoxin component YwqK of YwqJK toxin-antitoxin module